MKKLIVCIAVLCLLLCGCQNKSDILQDDISKLQEEISNLEKERDYLQDYLTEVKEENDIKKYIVTFEIGQSHFTLDIGTHLKDSMNKLELEVMVSKEYYDSVNVGTVINDDFRVGSFLMEGSVGNWEVEVIDKRVE